MPSKWLLIPVYLCVLAGCGMVGQHAPPPEMAGTCKRSVEDARSQAAVDVVCRYYAAISAGDYRTAYEQWGESGPPDSSYDDFVRGYGQTVKAAVEVTGDVRIEGAAGSLYANVPVEVRAELDDGRVQHYVGDYVVRRVNDVPGATDAQLRWHLENASLRPGS